MASTNFDFLKNPLLIHHAALAEKYCYEDPDASLLNLRKFSEALIDIVFERLGVKPLIPEAAQGARVAHLNDLHHIPAEVAAMFTIIREAGNAAAHVRPLGSVRSAEAVLKTAWDLSVRFHRDVCENYSGIKPFALPPKSQDPCAQMRQEISSLTAEVTRQTKRADAAEFNLARLQRQGFFAFSRRADLPPLYAPNA